MLRGYSAHSLGGLSQHGSAVRHRRYILILLTYTGRVLWNLELAKANNAPTLDRCVASACGISVAQPVG